VGRPSVLGATASTSTCTATHLHPTSKTAPCTGRHYGWSVVYGLWFMLYTLLHLAPHSWRRILRQKQHRAQVGTIGGLSYMVYGLCSTRYCIHFHMHGDVFASYVRNCTVHR
jgi:hypothetical protein